MIARVIASQAARGPAPLPSRNERRGAAGFADASPGSYAGVTGALLALTVAIVLPGCATPGPAHLYSTGTRTAEVHDIALDGHDVARDVPSFLEKGEAVTGFAYDPFTDHFFLRLAPGNRIRVVDRPARKVKREFTIDDPAAEVAGDVAVSPRDGHLFLVAGDTPELVETSRLGKVIRHIALAEHRERTAAVAFDLAKDHLLVLTSDRRGIDVHDRDGRRLRGIALDRQVGDSIAFDAEARELYAPLAGVTGTIGVFAETGRIVRTLQAPEGRVFIDVGPHSFLRVF